MLNLNLPVLGEFSFFPDLSHSKLTNKTPDFITSATYSNKLGLKFKA